ncbi:hypothetical protein PoB_001437300 [Plakobranchus ocellatus]|uniref:Uncharacterized protein n=1 Tax=Plakobranchus ocellatus TaxID=259542 RepID=A0AAV3YZS0_9GAST|nr:hypothetical protein PoB_001437300 [Plakobranchus ocellatus]
MDQSLYTLAKTIQWNWPSTYGEQNLTIMMVGCYVEQAALRTLGDWLSGYRWTSAIAAAGVASCRIEKSFLKASMSPGQDTHIK